MTKTTRIALVFALAALATGCVVAGEEDPTLEEIELDESGGGGGAECSVAEPRPVPPGSMDVYIEMEGRPVSPSTLTSRQRYTLAQTIAYIEATVGGSEAGCEFSPSGWYCDTGDYLCSCDHTQSTGPQCRCDAKC